MSIDQQLKIVHGFSFAVASRTPNPEPRTLPPRRSSGAEGIALILVLGVLSLMLILAVSFAITMRTERLAAGNYADSVRARQLAQVGLARAMEDLCRILGTNIGHPGGQVYPPWSVTNSYSTNWTRAYATNMLRGSATNFVPRALWTDAVNADALDPTNHWVEIWSSNVVGVDTQVNLIGRVGYLILNGSGLLDANVAGGINRLYGQSPSEIAVNQLGELPVGFFANRDSDVRYESLEELAVLNIFQPANFCVYSRYPAGYWDAASGIVRTQVNLAGTAENIYNRRIPITDALTNAGFLSTDAYIIWRNLVDYVDSDSDPTNLTTCVEAVPMISEMVVSNIVSDAGGGNIRMDTTIYFELWYPFVRDSAEAFELQYKADFTDMGGGFVPADIPTWKSLAPTVTPGAQSFAVRSDPLPPVTLSAGAVKFKSKIDARMVFVAGGNEADKVESIEVTNENSAVPSFSIASSECLDPRFNGYLTNWQSAPYATLGNVNPRVTNYWANNPSGDTDSVMYVANGPLHSAAEIGCLVYSSNAPWHTVKLYGTNLHRVLDVFALDTNLPNADYVVVTNCGLVNPNSEVTNALAAVFADMPVDEYPGGPSNLLSMTAAQTVADRLYTGRFYTNLSDIGRGLTDFSGLGFSVSSELQKESFFRNACGLLSPRQNLFTILIEAQAASGDSIPRNMARQRAVAVVWRDPYTGEFVVRSFQWLED